MNELGRGCSGAGKFVVQPQGLPFVCTQLVEGEYFNAFDAAGGLPGEVLEVLGEFFDVLGVVAPAGDEDVADPCFFAHAHEALGKVERGLQGLSCQPLVLLWVDVFDVEQDEVYGGEPVVVKVGCQEALGIDGGVQTILFFDAVEDFVCEMCLQEGFSAGECDAASDFEKAGVFSYFGNEVIDSAQFAVMEFPCVGVVAVQAFELAAAEEGDKAHAWAVNGGACFD